jgi:pantoate kinase
MNLSVIPITRVDVKVTSGGPAKGSSEAIYVPKHYRIIVDTGSLSTARLRDPEMS